MHGVRVDLVRQHRSLPELGRDHVGLDHVPVLAGDVAADRVVPREGSVAVRTRHPDPLVPLPDVGPQVGLVPVGPLAERTLELSTWKCIL